MTGSLPFVPPPNLFQQGRFAAYIDDAIAQSASAPRSPFGFYCLVELAISLDQTKAWRGDQDRAVRKLAGGDPNDARYLDLLSQLMHNDNSGLARFFEGPPPKYDEWRDAVPVLRDHGYPVIADEMTIVLMTGDLGYSFDKNPLVVNGLTSWCALPLDDRSAIERFVTARLAGNAWGRRAIADTALDMLEYDADKQQYPTLEHCFWLYNDDFRHRSSLAYNRILDLDRSAFGIAYVLKVSEANKADYRVQEAVTRELAMFSQPPPDMDVYKKILNNAHEPECRTLRQFYLSMLTIRNTRDPDIPGVKPLVAADALLAAGNKQAAAILYKALLADSGHSLAIRLDACAGLVNADQLAGLNAAKRLVSETSNGSDLRWLGGQICKSIIREIALRKKPVSEPTSNHIVATAIIEEIIDKSPVDTLDIGDEWNDSLRLRAPEMLFAIGEKAQAEAILKRRISFDIQPPKGGWSGPPGCDPGPDAFKARHDVQPSVPAIPDQWRSKVLALTGDDMTDLADF